MRAVVVAEPGGPEVLTVEDVPDPQPRPGEVIVDVAATAVNRADLLQRQGNYPPPPGAPSYLGPGCSGTIAELGDAVAGWNVGDPVCALLSGGGYAERVAVPVGQLLPVPAGVVARRRRRPARSDLHRVVDGLRRSAGRLQPGETAARPRGYQRHRHHRDPTGQSQRRNRVHHRRDTAQGRGVPRTRGRGGINYHDEPFEDRMPPRPTARAWTSSSTTWARSIWSATSRHSASAAG